MREELKIMAIQMETKQIIHHHKDNSSENLENTYVPHKIENIVDVSTFYFSPVVTSKDSYSLIFPPPNITGTLHLGHVLTASVQDALVKWKQMKGISTIWVPGMDHAGIATQVVVEKKLWKEQRKTRQDLGRLNFEKKIWKWKEENSTVIGEQLRRLGLSLNWDREMFTVDYNHSQAVNQAFIKLYEKGMIYRKDALVNWSCSLQSAISDIEVDHVQLEGPTKLTIPGYEKPVEFGNLMHVAYKICDSDEEIVISTTRVETILADVAIAVHPQDSKYGRHIGKSAWHPFRKQKIPIIADEFVQPEFGTGAVKITPGHNHIDFEVSKRHNLEVIQMFDTSGNLTENCGEFCGLRRFDARNVIMNQLRHLDLIRGSNEHQMIVPICSRSRDVVEFLIKPQWFLKSSVLADGALEAVRTGNLIIEPKRFERTWFNWLENIRDWCISRQLWWGHRIPVYSCNSRDKKQDKVWVAAGSVDEALSKATKLLMVSKEELECQQDEDVLDTWFSSGLLPFSVFGWPNQTQDYARHYPLSLMETGHDILFFWVARMVMLGTALTGKLPFNKILLHGIICDSQGRKMSKSLGNVIVPEDVITGATLEKLAQRSMESHNSGVLSKVELKRSLEGQKKMFPEGIPECGADALRFTLLSSPIKNHFIHFNIQECYTNKLFCNKILQATKFTKSWYDNITAAQGTTHLTAENLRTMDNWILSRLTHMVDVVNTSLNEYDFHVATQAIKNFLYYNFCDVYLETSKRGLRTADSMYAAGHCWTLVNSLDVGLRCLAPFMPHIAQYLHQRLPTLGCKDLHFPENINRRDELLEKKIEEVLAIVIGIRRLKNIFKVTATDIPKAQVISNNLNYAEFREVIEDLTACQEVLFDASNLTNGKFQHFPVKDVLSNEVIIYLNVPKERINVMQLDLPRLQSKKLKLLKELDRVIKVTSSSAYTEKAAAEVQKSHSKKIAVLKEKIARIEYVYNMTKQCEL